MLTFSHDSDLQSEEPGCLHHLADSLKDELVSPHVVVKSCLPGVEGLVDWADSSTKTHVSASRL